MVNAKNISAFDYSKIVSEKQLTRIIKSAKSDKKTVGLCVGSYDLLHPGHMKHFESAKDLCDILIVSVTADKYVRKRKGLNRPIISEDLRAYSISQLTSVDYVMISPYERAVNVIELLKPSYYIKGSDYVNKQTPGITAERKAIANVGGEMKYTHDEKFSTTSLMRRIQKKTDKPVLVVGAGMAGVGQSTLLKEFAKKNDFMYIDKDVVDQSFLTTIQDGVICNQKDTRSSFKYHSDVKYQTYLTMLQLAEINLSLGFNVVLDGYFSDKLQISFIKKILSELLKEYCLIKIYFTASKKTVLSRMKQRNFDRDIQKIKDFDRYFKKHIHDDVSQFDIVFNTDGDLSVNVDSLSHEMMNVVYGK